MKIENISAFLVVILVLLGVGGVLIILLISSNLNLNTGQKSCFIDSDCVPAQCCHPTDVVNKLYAPSCSSISCTEECRDGTLDCGSGKPSCVNSKCVIIWTK